MFWEEKMIKKLIISLYLPTTFLWVPFCSAVSINDISQVTYGEVVSIKKPQTHAELSALLQNTSLPISLAGGRYSMGGHIWHNNGIVIDMTAFNAITQFDRNAKTITVEAGIRWRDIQIFIAPHNLAIQVMQSYNDFTVGGSLSVNAHGRDTSYGQLIETIQSMKVMVADGTIMHVDRLNNYNLFRAIIGGYGSCGIILEATINLTANENIKCKKAKMKLADYKKFFFSEIHGNPKIALHNAQLYPNDLNEVLSVGWYKTAKPLTITSSLMPVPSFPVKEYILEGLLRHSTLMRKTRGHLEWILLNRPATVVSRNYEMSYSVTSLDHHDRTVTTNILQEYFIPIDALEEFIATFRSIIPQYHIRLLNVSIRYVPANKESLLTYAPTDSFALVCYINMGNNPSDYTKTAIWTQTLIDKALQLKGTYYLPYQLFATQEQFIASYPGARDLKSIKNKYDPENRFSNSFVQKYLLNNPYL